MFPIKNCVELFFQFYFFSTTIVCGDSFHFLVWKKPNTLGLCHKYLKKKEYQLPKNETIKDIASGNRSYQILTESGKVWSLANRNEDKEVPLLDADKSNFEKIRPVTFFEEEKLFVNSLIMGRASGYYLCNGDQLYASGSNAGGRIGLGQNIEGERMPVYVQDKVIKIFGAGSVATNFFFITSKPDLFYACGNNDSGELGVDSRVSPSTPAAVKNFKGSEILTEKKAVQLATGHNQNLVLTDQNELYGWGFTEHQFPTDESSNNRCPTKISLPGFFSNYLGSKDMIRIACGAMVCFLFLDFNNALLNDLRTFYESKKFCDCEIVTLGNKIPVHKSLIEFRTKLTIDQIQNKLFGEKSSINKEQTLSFLKWVYYDEISEIEKLEQSFNSLELTFPSSVDNTLEKDIAQLYKDDDSKDFKILVKIDDDEDDEDEEGNYEEIPVHKFILLARSGLFREMFDNVNEKENTNMVKDYSNRSIESLEILIKYFYTNSIEFTADQDPKLIVDELSDAVEYYQLNDQCNFENELLEIKKHFDLN
ncbi:hypothetical protein M0812_09650 [Anaeramoeba flamelloides]|uniref:BTB domain-containing protein n=1 Tax=Anaeramoeba flamelloides TaxID=1746091 RepID=A0AAV7ZP68_9EUKA|nr:hypothetical protein M0812_09650 [Anaeramoeba flamelloides]